MDRLSALPAATGAAVEALRQGAAAVIARTVAAALADRAAAERMGADAEQAIAIGIRFTTDGLVTAMQYGTVELLEDQLVWAVERLPKDGVPPTDLLRRLELYREAVVHELPTVHSQQVLPFVDWMLDWLRLQLRLPDEGSVDPAS